MTKAADEPYAWLFKEEPDHYSYADLEHDGSTLWNGVTNNLARLHLRKVKKGQRILYYHTGKEKAIVGEMKALGGPELDPTDGDPKAVAIRVEPVRRYATPVTLKEIKADKSLTDWDLVRISRLSVVPVTREQWERVQALRKSNG